MATLIPSLPNVTRRMTPGERRIAQRLESHLQDDYLCWYDVPIGPKNMDHLVMTHHGSSAFVERLGAVLQRAA